MVGGADVYDDGLSARTMDVAAIEREYEVELRRLDRPMIAQDARDLRADWDSLDREEMRRLLSLAITAVMVRPGANRWTPM